MGYIIHTIPYHVGRQGSEATNIGEKSRRADFSSKWHRYRSLRPIDTSAGYRIPYEAQSPNSRDCQVPSHIQHKVLLIVIGYKKDLSRGDTDMGKKCFR